MTITLPQELEAFVKARVTGRGFASASEYVSELVRRDEERARQERFEALIQHGLDSPCSTRTWEELSDDWTARIAAAHSAKSLSAQ